MLILFSLVIETKPSSLKKLIYGIIFFSLISYLAYFIGVGDTELLLGSYIIIILNACILFHFVIDFVDDLKKLKRDWQQAFSLMVVLMFINSSPPANL